MSLDNPTQKGTLGEIAVCKDLIQLGYKVFVEFGTFSKIDLIVLDHEFRVYKLQVKAVESKNEIVAVLFNKDLSKSEIQFGLYN